MKPAHKRAGGADHTYYATDPLSVRALLDAVPDIGGVIWDPACGTGNISKELEQHPGVADVISTDLVDRGYGVGNVDFLSIPGSRRTTDWVVTNPPYKDAKAFVERSLAVSKVGVAMFLRIQFLEGQSRRSWHMSAPLSDVLVFSSRQAVFRNGEQVNPATGRKWANTFCFAWFVWRKGYTDKPRISWLP